MCIVIVRKGAERHPMTEVRANVNGIGITPYGTTVSVLQKKTAAHQIIIPLFNIKKKKHFSMLYNHSQFDCS